MTFQSAKIQLFNDTCEKKIFNDNNKYLTTTETTTTTGEVQHALPKADALRWQENETHVAFHQLSLLSLLSFKKKNLSSIRLVFHTEKPLIINTYYEPCLTQHLLLSLSSFYQNLLE